MKINFFHFPLIQSFLLFLTKQQLKEHNYKKVILMWRNLNQHHRMILWQTLLEQLVNSDGEDSPSNSILFLEMLRNFLPDINLTKNCQITIKNPKHFSLPGLNLFGGININFPKTGAGINNILEVNVPNIVFIISSMPQATEKRYAKVGGEYQKIMHDTIQWFYAYYEKSGVQRLDKTKNVLKGYFNIANKKFLDNSGQPLDNFDQWYSILHEYIISQNEKESLLQLSKNTKEAKPILL